MSCHDRSTPGSAGAPLVRPSYFFGQVLGVDDFRDEQTYHMQARRRHDLALHGWGEVSGLEVTVGAGGTVEVSAGVAVDPCGREIVVPEAAPVQLGPYQGSPGPSEDLDVVLRYAERAVAWVPALGGVGGGPDESQPSRVDESFEINVPPSGTVPPADGVVLARIRRSSDGSVTILDDPARRALPTVERLLTLIEELQTRVAALEAT